MGIEENKAIVGRGFDEFWGAEFNPAVIKDGKAMPFIGISILRVENGLITEELGLDDRVTVQQLDLVTPT